MGGPRSQLMRGAPSHVGVGPCSDLYRWVGWRVGPEKGGYRTSGRECSLLLIRRCFSHVQEQRLKNFSLKQCTEMLGGEVRGLPAEQAVWHAFVQAWRA